MKASSARQRGACGSDQARRVVALVCMAALFAWGAAGSAGAATFVVSGTMIDDLVDASPGNGVCAAANGACTLRAAIQEANALAGADDIVVPAGTFELKVAGRGEDDAASGDLDVLSDMTIAGSPTGMTNLLGTSGSVGGVDRVFDVIGPAVVKISRVVIQKGNADNEDGGAIRNDAKLSLEEVAIVANQAKNGNGGGIANINRGELQLLNVTLSQNVAATMSGGGLANFDDATALLRNCTVVNNSAQTGGGINNRGHVQLHNTILAGNSLGGNCSGRVADSLGHNLDSGTTCVLGPAELSSTDPKLGALVLSGGTLAHEPTDESPALEAGDNSDCPAVDQRLFPRPIDLDLDGTALCDIGAIEHQPLGTPTATPTRTLTRSPTVTATASPLATSTSTRVATSPPTPEATATITRTATTSVTPTRTPTVPEGASPTQSPTVSATVTRSPSPTEAAATATQTATVTSSPVSTQTPTATAPTPTPSRTRTPTETPLRAAIQLGSATGVPGQEVSLSATLTTEGLSVAAAQADLVVDGVNLAFAVRSGGLPDCTVNPQIDRLPTFTFVPANCQPNCNTLRAGVFDTTPPITAIPDGSELFTCKLRIPPAAALGIQSVGITRLQMSDPRGLPVPNVGYGGIVVVVASTATPTQTPTRTPTVTVTATETPTPTSTPTGSPSSTPSRTATATASPTISLTPTLRPTATPTRVSCSGDCNLDGAVTVEEVVQLVNVALGTAPASGCPAGDGNGDGQITVEDVLRAVINALGGCR